VSKQEPKHSCRFVLCVPIIVGLAGCVGLRAMAPIPSPFGNGSSAYVRTIGYKVLYSFKGGIYGSSPESRLLDVNGTLYGTTFSGGNLHCLSSYGCGLIFKASVKGAVRILHRFAGSPYDGSYPFAGLIEVNGKIYGTTSRGGTRPSASNGTVYEISSSGQERVLYSFANGGDGQAPTADLIALNGTLYGTTRYGGASRSACYSGTGCGTIYKVSLSGDERVIYSFQGSAPPKDGVWPYAGLTLVNGTLYGVTGYGGSRGGGTVFSVTKFGKEQVVHNFARGRYGYYPYGALTLVNGELYGTTVAGGAYGDGAVFKISPSGQFKLLHTFKGYPTDGASPASAMVAMNGELFGTTSNGGSNGCTYGTKVIGCGTIFEITTSGKESVLYNFKGGKDGQYPAAPLITLNEILYGTTSEGGTGNCSASGSNGCGTIFQISPQVMARS
jgi:uncharacterized repeat protein (TIGR03803 family)